MPPAEPVASSVLQARASDVSELMIAGKLRKQDGKLFDVDLDSLRKRIGASQKHLIEFARSAIAVVLGGDDEHLAEVLRRLRAELGDEKLVDEVLGGIPLRCRKLSHNDSLQLPRQFQ